MRIFIKDLKDGLIKFVQGIDTYLGEIFWTNDESKAHTFEPAVAHAFVEGRLLKPYNPVVK
jgi:hypothetical protein